MTARTKAAPSSQSQLCAEVLDGAARLSAQAWDACANPVAGEHHPFVAHGFFTACEESGSAARGAGWVAQHIVLKDGDEQPVALLPLYVKSHSQGEYVFDHGWADAFMRAGGEYYPKLLCAVPFTPVAGPRFLIRAGEDRALRRRQLVAGAITLLERLELSSLHLNFLPHDDWEACGEMGLLQRTDQQFYWHNEGYTDFDDFLAALSSRKRKNIRKERAAISSKMAAGLTIETLRGDAITPAHWDDFFAFYQDTGSRKWGRPYLTRDFFTRLHEHLRERALLVLAHDNGRALAGALHLVGSDALYGRYWGCLESHKFLHFELCYYQAMDYAIAHKLARVEAGAQGPHKLARGYLPQPTYSAHYIAHDGLRQAVAQHLQLERRETVETIQHLQKFSPFK